MIMDNENKKISRSRGRKIERRNKINDDLKLLLYKIRSERKEKQKFR